MKIEKCQETISKPDKVIDRTQDSISNKSDTCISKNFTVGDIRSKKSALTVSQKSAHFFENSNNILKKSPNHLGDADTYFRRTLRSDDFDFWRKSHLDFNISNSSSFIPANAKNTSRVTKEAVIIKSPDMPSIQPAPMTEVDVDENETTGDDDEDLKEVDEMILKASKELEQVAQENQHLLELLEKPPEQTPEQEEYQTDLDNNVIKQLELAEREAKDTANKIYELKTRVGELLKKEELSEDETRELDIKNKELKEQMRLFEERTKRIQHLIEKTHIVDEMAEATNEMPLIKKLTPRGENISKVVHCRSSKNINIGEGVKIGCCSCCSENLRRIPSVPTIAKKLSQSYSMQEKLAAENSDLESVRFKLQEELLNKDQTLECMQRELSNMQNEMRVLARENVTLNEKLIKIQQKDKKGNTKINQKAGFMTSKKLQEYSDNTYELEKQLIEMENDVKCLHEEICAVQREREHLEKHRKMMVMPKTCMAPHVLPAFNAPINHSHSLNKGIPSQLIKELFDQYDKLENDLKFKINGVLTLKNDYDNLKKLTKEAEEYKNTTQEKVKECEKIMNKIKTENIIPAEQENQISTAKKRLKKAQETLKEEQQIIKDQKNLVEDITKKFIEAQQQIEEQRRSLDVKFENPVDTNLNLGAQIVTNLHDKLEEISI